MADKKRFGDKDVLMDQLVATIADYTHTTASAAAQLLYQLIRHPDDKKKAIKELERRFCR